MIYKLQDLQRNNIKISYKIFWLLFLFEFFSPIYDILFYTTNINLTQLSKIPILGLFFITVVFHIRRKLICSIETWILIIFGLFSFLYGLFENMAINRYFATHFYSVIMPIFSISYGIYFARDISNSIYIYYRRVMKIAFGLTVLVLILYAYLYHVKGAITYFGFGSYMPFVCTYLLPSGHYWASLVGFTLVVLSGKRSTLILMCVVFIVFYAKQFFHKKGRTSIALLFILALSILGFRYAEKKGYFSRIVTTINMDFADDESMFRATSGRWQEIQGVIKYLNSKYYRWIIGAGMGSQYVIERPDIKESDLSHYAHFSPLSYAFIFGFPMALFLYLALIKKVIWSLSKANYMFPLTFIMFFVGSIFGATILVDPKTWFFLGVVTEMRREFQNKKKGEIIMRFALINNKY